MTPESMMPAPTPVTGRRHALCEQDPHRLTGIDFVRVDEATDQTGLTVFFLVDPDILEDPLVAPDALDNVPAPEFPADQVRIVSLSGGESLAEVPVVRAVWSREAVSAAEMEVETRTVLRVETAFPGDFSLYRLFIDDPDADPSRIDRFFDGVEFSFQQGCPQDLDCRVETVCPPEEWVDVQVDYLARDFGSLRRALLDFAATRYPRWHEKVEADVGVMLTEVMAALGDELSYVQDRHAREAYLESASQRRSLRRHAQLVDYPLDDGAAATTLLVIDVAPGVGSQTVVAGTRVWAPRQGEAALPFELGLGFTDEADGFLVHEDWNELPAHVADESAACLPLGSTEIFVRAPDDDPVAAEDLWLDRQVVLETRPTDPSRASRTHLVQLSEVERTTDPLLLVEGVAPLLLRLAWPADQALPFELRLSETRVRGNVVPAVAGAVVEEFFVIIGNDDLAPEASVATAVERRGPLDALSGQRSPTFLHSLSASEERGLGWLGQARRAVPEVRLEEVDALTLDPLAPPRPWHWLPRLLDSSPDSEHFTLDDGTWRRLVGYRRLGEEIEHLDYASGAGYTLRFGDGEFGRVPDAGTVFRARYRTGPGREANLPAGSVTRIAPPDPPPPGPPPTATLEGLASAVSNPFPVTGGRDAESAEEIRQLAPEAFRAETFRAVRDEDYRQQSERLDWVERAGASARWTGSWLSEFVTVDPRGTFELATERRGELEAHLDCVRQVGREVRVSDPHFIALDLEISVCVAPSAYPDQVQARVVAALLGQSGARPAPGFFDPDHFTFGTPLRRAALEAAVQAVPGVLAVDAIRLRARGITDWRVMHELVFEVAADRILRLENDRRFPERGSLRVRAHRGA